MSIQTYHNDIERCLSNPELLALTNKFLTDFFALYAKTNNGKPDDGYAFGYPLVECLVNSDYLRNNNTNFGYALCDMGFAQNVINGMFERNVNLFKLNEKMLYIIENHKHQPDYEDWRYMDYKKTSKTIVVDDLKFEKGKSLKFTVVKANKKETTHAFNVYNAKSGYKGKVHIIFIGKELNRVELYHGTEKILTVDLTFNEIRPTIHHYKYVADINSFFSITETVCIIIEEAIKEK